MIEHEGKDFLSLLQIWKSYWEAFRHAAENGWINVIWSVCGAEYENAGVRTSGKSVP